jgi:hypothetical protein
VNSLHAAVYQWSNQCSPTKQKALVRGMYIEVGCNYPAYLPQGSGQDRGTFRRSGDAEKWQQFLHQSEDAMLPKFPWPHCPVQSTLREHKFPSKNGLMTVRYFAPSRYIFDHVCLTTGFSVSFCSPFLSLLSTNLLQFSINLKH